MANRLLNYKPEYWARTALMWLKNRRGMYPRVYRVLEEERREFALGDKINLRRPATFTAQNAPSSTAQDIKTGTVQMSLDIYKEVKISASDLETVTSGERLITEHIGPMADALYDDFEARLYALAAHVPHTYDFANATDVAKKYAAMRRIMVENKVPRGARIEYMASPLTIERSIGAPEFAQAQGAGDRGIATQTTGEIGPKYGFNFFESTMPTLLEGDEILAPAGTKIVVGTPQKNATSITLDTGSAQTLGLNKGQVIAITSGGITDRYAVTADVAAVSNGWPNVPISPPLRRDLTTSSPFALVSTVGLIGSVANYQADLLFHKNAFAAVTVPLPQLDGVGVQMYTAEDPDTGMSVRARVFYDGHAATRYIVLDMWGGVGVLDPDLALRACSH